MEKNDKKAPVAAQGTTKRPYQAPEIADFLHEVTVFGTGGAGEGRGERRGPPSPYDGPPQ